MSSHRSAPDDLRRQVDEIDDAIFDLLVKRARLGETIARAGTDGQPSFQPGREEAILRRLVARTAEPLPVSAMVRIWREIFAASMRLQGNFAVAVHVPEDKRDLWDLARDHYGSITPISAMTAATPALRAVIDGSATVAVLPWPEDNDPEPWWPTLMSLDSKTPRVVACLPFLAASPGEGHTALAVARTIREPTGDDHTLIGVELSGDVSRSRLKEALEAVNLHPLAFWGTRVGGGTVPLYLIEVAGYVGSGDPRLDALLERLGEVGQRILPIGGFATPLTVGRTTRKGKVS